MHSGVANSSPAFSTPAFSTVPNFPVLHFQRLRGNLIKIFCKSGPRRVLTDSSHEQLIGDHLFLREEVSGMGGVFLQATGIKNE